LSFITPRLQSPACHFLPLIPKTNEMEGVQFHVDSVEFIGCSSPAHEDRLRAMIDIRQGDVYSSRKEKAAFEELKKFGVTKDLVHWFINTLTYSGPMPQPEIC
jgi:hypothetical protein